MTINEKERIERDHDSLGRWKKGNRGAEGKTTVGRKPASYKAQLQEAVEKVRKEKNMSLFTHLVRQSYRDSKLAVQLIKYLLPQGINIGADTEDSGITINITRYSDNPEPEEKDESATNYDDEDADLDMHHTLTRHLEEIIDAGK
jgi:hypothetical protein